MIRPEVKYEMAKQRWMRMEDFIFSTMPAMVDGFAFVQCVDSGVEL